MSSKKLDIRPVNENGQPHGYHERYYGNGNLRSKGHYVNGNGNGFCEGYYSDGDPWYKGNWINGNRYGYFEQFNVGGKKVFNLI